MGRRFSTKHISRSTLLVGVLALATGGLTWALSVPPVHQAALGANHLPAMSIVGGCHGTPVFLGTIDFTNTSKNNTSASTPFSNTGDGLAGKVLMVHASTSVFILPGTSSSAAVTSTNGVPLTGNTDPKCFYMHPAYTALAALRQASDGNLKVWEMIQ
jgi:hypothetical protein